MSNSKLFLLTQDHLKQIGHLVDFQVLILTDLTWGIKDMKLFIKQINKVYQYVGDIKLSFIGPEYPTYFVESTEGSPRKKAYVLKFDLQKVLDYQMIELN
jgi:hypothetical protein